MADDATASPLVTLPALCLEKVLRAGIDVCGWTFRDVAAWRSACRAIHVLTRRFCAETDFLTAPRLVRAAAEARGFYPTSFRNIRRHVSDKAFVAFDVQSGQDESPGFCTVLAWDAHIIEAMRRIDARFQLTPGDFHLEEHDVLMTINDDHDICVAWWPDYSEATQLTLLACVLVGVPTRYDNEPSRRLLFTPILACRRRHRGLVN